jgi:hypothetical protein
VPDPSDYLKVRPQHGQRTNDCSIAAVRDAITAEIRALPFLGTLDCSADHVVAGAYEEILLTYTVGGSGVADSGWLKLCFRYYSDWDFQTDEPSGADYVTAELAERSLAGGASEEGAASARRLRVHYDVKGGERPFQKTVAVHVEDGYLRPGDTLHIRLGDRRYGGPGTRVQTFVEDAFAFHLYVDPLGTSRFAHAAESRLAIVPGSPERLIVNGPRVVRAGEAARLRAHLEDRWGNACRDVAGVFRARINGRDVATGTTPAAGWAASVLTAPELPVGSARIDATADFIDDGFLESHCYLDTVDDFPAERAYFADLHVHSDDTVGTQDTAWNLAYGREIGALDVLGYTANDFQITDEVWSDVVARCRAAAEEGEFVCFPGVEWCGTAGAGGDHNVVFLGDDTTLARSLEWHSGMATARPAPQAWPITELYAAYEADPESYLLIPHVGGRRAVLDWHHPELERLIEVHSSWGTSPWFLEDAMARGLRLGVSAASDEHRGRPGSGAPGANIFGASGGLTGVLAPALTSADVGRALRDRRTWASTGARAVALLRAGDHWMGDEIVAGDADLAAEYALYGTSGWEEVRAYDAAGELWRRDLHTEAGLSDQLVRIRWGGARHRDRYRWATWQGRLHVSGTAIKAVEPWARTHPEQRIVATADGVEWHATTYGADTGAVLRLTDLAAARLDLDVTLAEDGLRRSLSVDGAELLRDRRRELSAGGAGLHVSVERIAEPPHLPLTVRGNFTIGVPPGDSALYVRARQWDGHQVWTSPLYFSGAEQGR